MSRELVLRPRPVHRDLPVNSLSAGTFVFRHFEHTLVAQVIVAKLFFVTSGGETNERTNIPAGPKQKGNAPKK